MATWKKVIVSGSNAHLTGITSSVLTANNILQAGTDGAIQNSGITLSGNTLALGGNSITSTGTASSLSGSFSGSFTGTFSGSLSVDLQDLTAGNGIEDFSYDGNSTATVQAAVTANGGEFLYWSTPLGKSRFTGSGGLSYDNLNDRILVSKALAPSTSDAINIGVSAANRFNQVYVRDIFARSVDLQAGLTVSGNTTLGDASADAVTVNAQTVTLQNPLAVGALSSTMLVLTSSNRVATQTLGSGIATFLNSPSSANLAAAVTDETGTGTLVFSASPTFTGTTTLTGDLLANGNTTLGNQTSDTLIISGSSISVPSIGAGSTDTVIIRTATNTLATRTIDSRVWGSTLVDASGTPVANQVPYWTDANTLAGEAGFTYNPSTNIFTAPNVVITSNLTVQGTASFQQTTNLEVADRFILLASGSNTAGEGGIVVQQATQNVGEIFGWDNDALRWAVTSSFTANQSSFTPDAFMAAVTTAAGTTPSVAARYSAVGNIYVSSGDESIWIYS